MLHVIQCIKTQSFVMLRLAPAGTNGTIKKAAGDKLPPLYLIVPYVPAGASHLSTKISIVLNIIGRENKMPAKGVQN